MICERLRGGSVKVCECRLPNLGGWLECPPEARGELEPAPVPRLARMVLEHAVEQVRTTGDICADCGSVEMMRTGTCLTCMNCGSSSGGCS
jgi:hypothetical protein